MRFPHAFAILVLAASMAAGQGPTSMAVSTLSSHRDSTGSRAAAQVRLTSLGLRAAAPLTPTHVWQPSTPGRAPVAALLDDRQQDRGRRLRPALVASAALGVTGAVLAYWSSQQADDAYDRYLRSAGEGRQRRAIDRAERYDRLAGAAFVTMEVGLALSVYYAFF